MRAAISSIEELLTRPCATKYSWNDKCRKPNICKPFSATITVLDSKKEIIFFVYSCSFVRLFDICCCFKVTEHKCSISNVSIEQMTIVNEDK